MQLEHDNTAVESNLTESEELFESIHDSVTGLFHLSLIIQRATPRDRFARALSSLKDEFSSVYDTQHVAHKFPKLDDSKFEWLRRKFGTANAQRRTFFRYCENHYEKKAVIAEQVPDIPGDKTIAQTVASTLNPDLLVEPHNEAFLEEDNFSQSSFATSIDTASNSDRLHVPHLNTVSEKREAFQCPYCYTIINPQSHRAWK